MAAEEKLRLLSPPPPFPHCVVVLVSPESLESMPYIYAFDIVLWLDDTTVAISRKGCSQGFKEIS